MSLAEPEVGRTASAEQARLLLDSRLHPLLNELARLGVSSAGQLARVLGRPLSSVHAQLERLLAAGVVLAAGQQARAGRPLRLYRLPLPWSVPFEVTPAATLRELLDSSFETRLREQFDQLAGVMGRAEGQWEVLLEWQNGQLGNSIRPQRRSEVAPLTLVVGAGADLRLSPERVHDLKLRLTALLEEFQASPDEAGERWSLTVLLTPQAGTP